MCVFIVGIVKTIFHHKDRKKGGTANKRMELKDLISEDSNHAIIVMLMYI